MIEQRIDPARASDRGKVVTSKVTVFAVLFVAGHALLAFFLRDNKSLATFHAAITLAVGLWLALSTRKIEKIVYISSYIVGAELIWRMSGGSLFWELGKYGLSAILLISTLRMRRLRFNIPILVYFLLLLPSISMTLSESTFEEARQQVSFNLSGPFALMACVFFFERLRLSSSHLIKLSLFAIGPMVTVATLAIVSTFTAESINFSDSSNFVTSGGYGPNQVSSILGLGALFAFLIFILSRKEMRSLGRMMFVIIVVLGFQSALTFSRGGIYLAFLSAVISLAYFLREPRLKAKVILTTFLLFVITTFLVVPRLDSFTGGAFKKRFENPSTTGRDTLVKSDLEEWKENFISGVGPGQARFHRSSGDEGHVAHTEFSRLLAEHGLYGLGALLMLLIAMFRSFARAGTNLEKAVTASLFCWSFLYMAIDAMRLVAPCFIFGLAFASFHLRSNIDFRPTWEPRKRRIVW